MNASILRPFVIAGVLALTQSRAAAQGWLFEAWDDYVPGQSQFLQMHDLAVDELGRTHLVGTRFGGSTSELVVHGYHALLGDDGAPLSTREQVGSSVAFQRLQLRGSCIGPSGELVVAGYVSDDQDAFRPWLGAIDVETGVTLWDESPTGKQGYFSAVAAIADGFLAVGRIEQTNRDTLAVRLDQAGNVIWRRALGDFYENDEGLDVVGTPDGGAAIVGTMDTDVMVLKFDAQSGFDWTRRFHLEGQQKQVAATLGAGGNLLIAATVDESVPNFDLPVLVCIDPASSAVQWAYEYAGLSGGSRDLCPTPDGGTLVASRHRVPSSTYFQAVLTKLDADGAVSWRRRIELPGQPAADTVRLQPHPAGGYVLAFRTDTTITGETFRNFVVRLDESGAPGASCDIQSIPTTALSEPITVGTSTFLSMGVTPLPSLDAYHAFPIPSTALDELHCTEGCAPPTGYCFGTSANSTGAQAILSSTGSTSIADNTFTLQASNLPLGAAICFYGRAQASVPFMDGLLCVAPPIFRLNPPGSISPEGIYTRQVDFTSLGNPDGMIGAHETWYFQCWYRDVPAGGSGSNVSTALEVSFCP